MKYTFFVQNIKRSLSIIENCFKLVDNREEFPKILREQFFMDDPLV
jgi:hypothetical protein